MTSDYNIELYDKIRRGDEFVLIKANTCLMSPDHQRDYNQELNSPVHKFVLEGSKFIVEEKGYKNITEEHFYWMIGRNMMSGDLYSFSLKKVNKYDFTGVNLSKTPNYNHNEESKLLLC